MGALHEKWRPRSWQDVVGQEKAVSRLRGIEARGGFGGNTFLITGPSGAGKTTLATLIAQAHGGDVENIDGRRFGIDRLSAMEDEIRMMQAPLYAGMPGKTWIINEVHGIRADVLTSLLNLIDPGPVPANVCIIFVTTVDGLEKIDGIDASPFLSRCLKVPLSQRGLAEAFARRAQHIAQTEGLDGRPLESYIRLAKECRNNLRDMIGEIQAGAMLTD